MAPDPNAVTAEFAGTRQAGRISALEGGGGYLRLALSAPLPVGETLVLEMHDGARFRMTVVEALGQGEYRLKLAGQERAAGQR